MITQKQLKEILHYDSESGVFTWKIKASTRSDVGDIAGTIDNKGYRRIGINNRYYRAHRLAWFYVYGVWPKNQIDHKNRIRDDNGIDNLRDVNNSENSLNRTGSINKFGVVGLSWCDKSKKFYSRITINGKTKYLGYFCNMFDAICARKSAELRLV